MLDFEEHIHIPTPLRLWKHPLFKEKSIEVYVKEDYRTHAAISGNKFRKLKYNLLKAEELGQKQLVSFGGAYSNHIYALAAVGKLFNFQTIGIIRGDELTPESSPTLRFADEQGMQLHFVSRTAYRDKEILRKSIAPDAYYIPEGGSNREALKGMSEVMDELLKLIYPTHICVAAGTGGSAAGLCANKNFSGQINVFPVLKNGDFIGEEIATLLGAVAPNAVLHTAYHFGGYGKYNEILLEFINEIEKTYQIPLDQVYTGKLFYGFLDLVSKDYFDHNSKIVLYHSGGLQGKIKAHE